MIGARWDVGFPALMVLAAVVVLVFTVREKDGLGPTTWRSRLFFVFWGLTAAGDSLLGQDRPRAERQWKGAVAVLLGLALAVDLWKLYRRRGTAEPPAPSYVPVPFDERDGLVAVRWPAMGDPPPDATVVRWFRRAGDRVEAGEPLLEIATGKVEIEIPADVSGVLWRIDAADGMTVPAGAVLALLEADRG
jgi:biotin-dependent enzyme